MIPTSRTASPLPCFSLNNPATQVRGPLSTVTGVSNINSQLVLKSAEQQFISHHKSVTELLTQAVSLAQNAINTRETDSAQRAQEPANGALSRDSVDNHAEVTQNSRVPGDASLNEKIAKALEKLPTGEKFAAQKAETAKQALLNEIATFQLPGKTVAAFTAIVENNSGNADPRAMKCVEDFMVMHHEIKSRLAPDDSKAIKELKNLTKSFIPSIVKNGVGMDSPAAGSSKNHSELKKHQAICNNLVALDKHSQQSSGLSFNVEIANRIYESLINEGLSQEECVQVMDNVHNIFRNSIAEQNSSLSIINRSRNLSPFEQAQTRLGQESITFDLLRNALADIAQPKADDAANPGPGPEIEMGPSNQPGINITINAPFTYTYHEGNQGSESPGMASGSQPAFTTSSGITQTDDPIAPQSVTTAVGTEEMDSTTHPLQDSQRPTMTNAVERSVQHAPDLSEQDSQTTSPDESPRQSVSRGLGSNNDAANELHHDVIDGATGPAVQPTDQQEEQNTVNATRTDQASGTDGDRASLRSPVSSYIGGPGSANARSNPAEARRIVEPGPRVLNSQGTLFRMPASSLAGNMPGKPASATTPDTSAGRMPDGGTTRNKETQTARSTLSQGTGDGKVRDATGQPPAAAKPDAPYIGGPGSANARSNPAEARRIVEPGPRVLNSQGTLFRMPVSSLAGNMPGKPASAATPDASAGRMPDGGTMRNKETQTPGNTLSQGTVDGKVRDAAGQPPAAAKPDAPYIGGPGSANARSNPAEARRIVEPGPRVLNSQGTQFRMPASSLAGNMPGKPASATTPDTSAGRMPDGGTTRNKETQTPGNTLSQGTGDGKVRDAAGQPPAAAKPDAPYIGGPGSANARSNPAEARRIVEPGPTMLNSQGTQFRMPASSLAGNMPGKPASATTPDTSAGRMPDGGTTRNKETQTPGNTLSQGTGDGKVRDAAGQPPAAAKPDAPYIGGPGSASARSNPAEARRMVQPGPTMLNSQGTQFRMPASSLAGNMPGKPASATTPDTSAGRMPDGGTTRNKETQTPGNTLSQGTGDGKVRDAAGQPPAAAKPDAPYIGGPGSANARSNPAEARRIVEPGPRVLNSQGTQFRMPASSLAGNMPGKPASAATPDASQGAGDGKAHDVTAQSPASATSGSLSARANTTEVPRSNQKEPGMLNRQGSYWQGLDGNQASKVTPGQTYKSSSFVGSRGSSQATPYFSGVSKSTAKK